MATLHLTSNKDPHSSTTRAAQIRTLLHQAQAMEVHGSEAPDLLIMGDFNFGDGAPEEQSFAEAGFRDAWKVLRPGEPGYTYDPARNGLAAQTTSAGQSQRFDHLMIRSASGRLEPRDVSLFGEEPLSGRPAPGGGPLFVSDHFGLSCTLARAASSQARPVPAAVQGPSRVLSVPPVHQAAVVLIPPEELWGPIETLRSKYDRTYERWMPHVTLLYPFVPEEHFDEAEALIAEALRELKPFEVTLSGFSHFEHRGSVTAWLRPEDRPHGALKALQAALQAALPQCDEQGSKSENGFTPHLSVGQLPRSSPAEIRRTLSAWEQNWKPLTFEAREVCLISRRGDVPFEVRRRVRLGGGDQPGPGSGSGSGGHRPARPQGSTEAPAAGKSGPTEGAHAPQEKTGLLRSAAGGSWRVGVR